MIVPLWANPREPRDLEHNAKVSISVDNNTYFYTNLETGPLDLETEGQSDNNALVMRAFKQDANFIKAKITEERVIIWARAKNMYYISDDVSVMMGKAHCAYLGFLQDDDEIYMNDDVIKRILQLTKL